MSVTDAVVPDELAERPSPRSGRPVIALVVATGLVLLLAALGWRWLVNPDTVRPVGNAVSSTGPVGQAYFGTNISSHGPWDQQFDEGARTIDLVSITPHIDMNTADAVVTLALCLPKGAEGLGVGAPSDLRHLCEGAGVVPVTPGPIALGDPPDAQIVAVVTTHRAGVVHIAGYDVVYRDGIRRGSVLAGIVTTVTATAGS
jgi:hypothetical protein